MARTVGTGLVLTNSPITIPYWSAKTKQNLKIKKQRTCKFFLVYICSINIPVHIYLVTYQHAVCLEQNFYNLLLDVLFATKFNFHSSTNKLIEYCQHFFLIAVNAMIRGVDFLMFSVSRFKFLQKWNTESYNNNTHTNKCQAILKLS